MNHFLDRIIDFAELNGENSTLFIFPTKRANSLFKEGLYSSNKKARVIPHCVTWSELVDEISPYKTLTSSQSVFFLYNSYIKLFPQSPEVPFSSFQQWGRTVLADFESIVLNNLEGKKVLAEANYIKVLEKWDLDPDKSIHFKNIWAQLPDLFESFYELLEVEKWQTGSTKFIHAKRNYKAGSHYLGTVPERIVFCGFTAFSPAEKSLIKVFSENCEITSFYDEPIWNSVSEKHESNTFKSEHFDLFNKVENIEPFLGKKHIKSFECGNDFIASKTVSSLLTSIPEDEYSETAIVLLNDDDLPLVLNGLPHKVSDVNIGKGKSILNTQEGELLMFFIELFEAFKSTKKISKKHLNQLLELPLILRLLGVENKIRIFKYLSKENHQFYSVQNISECIENEDLLLVFSLLNNDVSFELFILELAKIKKLHFGFLKGLVNEIKIEVENFKITEANRYDYFRFSVVEKIRSLSVSISGLKSNGLQIISLLESRCLDFKNLIVLSFHEENLPQSNLVTNLPVEIRNQYKIPDLRHREAILSYHFMRLLKRGVNISLIYNRDSSGFNTQNPSRYLLQNALEWSKKSSNILFESYVLETSFNKNADDQLKIDKTENVIVQLDRYLSERGLSPSALNVLLNNPLDFLLYHILGLREKEEATFVIETSTIGTIVHDTLENLYKPFIGKSSKEIVEDELMPKIDELLNHELVQYYSNDTLQSGRLNILIPVLKKWISEFVSFDLTKKRGQDFILLDLEQSYLEEVKSNTHSFKIKGIVDRVEIMNGLPHLIDYKTGKVEQKDLNLKREELTELNPDKTKAYQLLFYTLLFHKSNTDFSEYTCSIYSFRNQKSGYINLKIDKKEIINTELLDLFEIGLQNTIAKLMDTSEPIRLENFRYQKFEV